MRRWVLLLVCGMAVLVLGRAENIRVTAHEDIKTYVLKNGRTEPTSTVIPAGTVLAVTGCDDLKHYIAVEVEYRGQGLLLLEGDYKLERHSFLGSWKTPLVFGCP